MENQKQVRKPRKLSVVLMSLLLAVTIGVNIAGIGFFYNPITLFFADVKSDTPESNAASDRSRDFIETLTGEGIVLLENKGGALPLDQSNEKQVNVNVFGWSSVSPVYVGVGSGTGNESNNVNVQQGLENAGFKVNSELTAFYNDAGFARKNENAFGRFAVDYRKHEVAVADYPQALLENAKAFSEVAVVILSRMGGELSNDLPVSMSEWDGPADEHYLELGAKEADMLEMVKGMGFQKVVVVINCSHPMELGFLQADGIDAAIWIGGPGQTGMNAVGRVLSGDINPSGRVVDTYAYDQTSAPSFQNFGDFVYTGTEGADEYVWGPEVHKKSHSYVDYAEGIYVGYRYYETRWVDNQTGETDEEAYRDAVLYPFGYGKSYTDFTQKIIGFQSDETTITMDVEVKNIGTAAGKEVVQVYYTPPYTIGGIEKSHVVLAEFGKTAILQPGASETVRITFNVIDMASYDDINSKAFVLEKGTYDIKLMSNAHDVIESRTYVVNGTIVYGEGNARPSDNIVATNQFDDVRGEVVYLSRADWEGTFPKNVPHERIPTPEILAAVSNFNPPEDPTAEDIVFAKHGLKLKDLVGLDYDDPKWAQLLEQLSVEDMQLLIGSAGFALQSIKSVGSPFSYNVDGPAGLRSMIVKNMAANAAQYCTQVVVAATWNQSLVREMGEVFGDEAVSWNVSGLYGPCVNLHRSPFANRNYEFYSEDPIISGKMVSAFTQGFQSRGAYIFVKHFALYEQSTNQLTVSTWCNEQTMRELYLKPFEMAFKDGGAKGVMSTYNRIGSTWSGGSYPLMTTVLRDEWGFQGIAVTDAYTRPLQNPNQAIHAGTDGMLSTVAVSPTDLTNAGKQEMRRACHNILYTTANSVAMEFADYGPQPYWMYITFGVDALILAAAGFFFFRWSKSRKQYEALQTEPVQPQPKQ